MGPWQACASWSSACGSRARGGRHPRGLGRRRDQDRAAGHRRPGAAVRGACSAATSRSTRPSRWTTAASARIGLDLTQARGPRARARADRPRRRVPHQRAAGGPRAARLRSREPARAQPAPRLRRDHAATGARAPTPTRPPTTSRASGRARASRTCSRQPGGPPPFQRGGMGDHGTGLAAAGAISAALFQRERSGKGQLVATSLLRQGLYTLSFDLATSLRFGVGLAVGESQDDGQPVHQRTTRTTTGAGSGSSASRASATGRRSRAPWAAPSGSWTRASRRRSSARRTPRR